MPNASRQTIAERLSVRAVERALAPRALTAASASGFPMLVTFCNMGEKGLTLSGVLRNVGEPTTVVPRP